VKNLWNREPAAILAAVQAVIALAVSFGLELTPEQIGSVLAVTATVLGLLTRAAVVPASILEQIKQQRDAAIVNIGRFAGPVKREG
jgi:hypothetical protein